MKLNHHLRFYIWPGKSDFSCKVGGILPQIAPRVQRPGLTRLVLIFVENCLECDAIHYFSVRLRTGSNLAFINSFRSHSVKLYYLYNFRVDKMLEK